MGVTMNRTIENLLDELDILERQAVIAPYPGLDDEIEELRRRIYHMEEFNAG